MSHSKWRKYSVYFVMESFITTTEISYEILTIVESDLCMLFGQWLEKKRRDEITENCGQGKGAYTEAEIIKSDGFDRPIIVSSERMKYWEMN